MDIPSEGENIHLAIFERAYNAIFGISRHENVSIWFEEALSRPEQIVDCVASFRRSLLSRKVEESFHAALLDLLDFLIQQPYMNSGGKSFSKGIDSPILSSMKAMQRQLCMRVGTEGAEYIIHHGFSCMSHWCTRGPRVVNMMEVIHCKIGVPILPYLGRVAILTLEPVPKKDFAYDLLRQLVPVCMSWLAKIKSRLDSEPLVLSPAARCAWITTLQQLRTYPASGRSRTVISLWLRLGQAHGFSERADSAWLSSGDNGRPSPPASDAQPWSFCGWKECLCHEQKPLYKLSACEGCQRAFYCGKICQRRAWTNGHKEVCARVPEN